MIQLEHLSKTFQGAGSATIVADNINLEFPCQGAVALLGRNGAGKSSLLKIIAGTMRPTHGRVVVDGTVSWPIGFAGRRLGIWADRGVGQRWVGTHPTAIAGHRMSGIGIKRCPLGGTAACRAFAPTSSTFW